MKIRHTVPGDDYIQAGKASAELKKLLGRLGIDPSVIKRAVVATYEGEMNMAIHAGGGTATFEVDSERLTVLLEDQGPGIADLSLAMTEGYSTADEHVREMGFGAGMGLPNMQRNADGLDIQTARGMGTTVTMSFVLKPGEKQS